MCVVCWRLRASNTEFICIRKQLFQSGPCVVNSEDNFELDEAHTCTDTSSINSK